MVTVFYHANCVDGFTAAWIARKNLGDNARYIPMNYDEKVNINDYKGDDIYILDFSFPRDVVVKLHDVAKSIVLLDHHKSAAEDLAGLSYCVFDISRCGSRLAWSYFNLNLNEYQVKALSKLVDYVGDRDLWQWKLPYSKEFSCWLRSFEMTFGNWDIIERILETATAHEEEWNCIITEGAAIKRYNDTQIKALCSKATEGKLCGYKVLAVNSPLFISDIGDELLNRSEVAVIYWINGPIMTVGLRSRGDVDVSRIAKLWGGGGHKNSAGFTADSLFKIWELG